MMQTTVPSEHQALGRKAKGFNRPKWDEREFMAVSSHHQVLTVLLDKSRIVEEGNYHKFTKGKESSWMAKKLLETGDRELVEVRACCIGLAAPTANIITQASPTDRIWGVGFGAADALENRSKWGENRLGEAITRVRERLQRESK
jgi:predicted NAD-dependent protein-ADP-ribosyltransferase YbiA (DUF1768 family)